jgi:glycine C-acetyltransferase
MATLHPLVSDAEYFSDFMSSLDEIKALCDKHDAMLMIDECHATGILGEKGRGTDELFGIHGQGNFIFRHCWSKDAILMSFIS